ncbi:hypothetical protein E2C01_064823 [Portunus trituberculatus]|uniref:Uncharacterized protein n=1 Tax=Portunus trituberculatus TaxID=210409 RepID=A0A5B7HCU8_PORTR|nr:hypothetical protein [Portunus trituberculatus]
MRGGQLTSRSPPARTFRRVVLDVSPASTLGWKNSLLEAFIRALRLPSHIPACVDTRRGELRGLLCSCLLATVLDQMDEEEEEKEEELEKE